jgi:hypothetical protein
MFQVTHLINVLIEVNYLVFEAESWILISSAPHIILLREGAIYIAMD